MTYDATFDFNTADSQRDFDLIPDDTICPVRMTVRPGGAGDGGWLKVSKAGDKLMVDAEFVVTEGEFAKRKFWNLFVVSGSEQAENISRSTLRAILESARNVRPDDYSDDAKRKRLVQGYGDFDGLEFVAKVGIEKGTDGYKDKNRLKAVVTPDREGYSAPTQASRPAANTAAAPQWAGAHQAPATGAGNAQGVVPQWAQ